MMTFLCAECGNETAYLDFADDTGANYTCPECGFEWWVSSDKDSETKEENGQEDYDEDWDLDPKESEDI
jgi:DNA-directed RNA polymerase subunit RPC12/RpoP